MFLSLKINDLSEAYRNRKTFPDTKLWIYRCPYPKNGILPATLVVASGRISRRFYPRCGILLPMDLTLAHIGPRPGPSSGSKGGFDSVTQVYLERCSQFARCQAEAFRTEEAMLDWLTRRQARTSPVVVLLDSRGRSMTSEAFAAWLGARRDDGAQHIVFVIGPADGWSDLARQRANLQLSLGPMTLAHSLARLVLAEQIYRAFTILSGHPYHAGH
jgi:23S rRNA (pseudouridine1915-N3)-methyltransferase